MDEHPPDGHEHLAHLPQGTAPAVFAAQADVVLEPRAHAGPLEPTVTRFIAALSSGLADAGCTLVGHIKGTLATHGHGGLAFHATALGAPPALTGGVAGDAKEAVLTVNVIVFGVDERDLPAIVTDSWSRACSAETTWRH